MKLKNLRYKVGTRVCADWRSETTPNATFWRTQMQRIHDEQHAANTRTANDSGRNMKSHNILRRIHNAVSRQSSVQTKVTLHLSIPFHPLPLSGHTIDESTPLGCEYYTQKHAAFEKATPERKVVPIA